MFTVSDAELAADRRTGGRRFTPDEVAALALIFFVTPMTLMVPPPSGDSEEVMVAIGTLVMPRESYLTDVLLMPSRLTAGRTDGMSAAAIPGRGSGDANEG